METLERNGIQIKNTNYKLFKNHKFNNKTKYISTNNKNYGIS